MKPTVSGIDDPGQRCVSQTATSSEAKLNVCPVTAPNRNITTYTTAQLHENLIKIIKLYIYLTIKILSFSSNTIQIGSRPRDKTAQQHRQQQPSRAGSLSDPTPMQCSRASGAYAQKLKLK